MPEYKNLILERENDIAKISIHRPEALNALNREVLMDLLGALHNLVADAALRGVILTGSGEKAFVAGADITAMKDMSALDADQFCQLGHRVMSFIENFPRPIVAAVNGFALGGGLELALSCDFIYAAKTAKFGLPEVNLGLFPGFGGTQRLSRLIGRARAKEMIFTADILNAEQALNWGIVNRVVESAELIPAVQSTLSKIAGKGSVAVKLAKRVINEGCDLPLQEALCLEAAQFPLTFATEDRTIGVNAFLNKQPAKFVGR